MGSIQHLLDNNAAWAAQCCSGNQNFFQDLVAVQRANYLWIGCSDARVPANTLLGLKPGEVFVHRNIANQVPSADLNCLAVIQHAIETLQVNDIIVCGHYGCNGIQGVLGMQKVGSTVNDWLSGLKSLCVQHQTELDAITDPTHRANRLAELNVQQQVLNVCQTSFAQNAWKAGKELAVHGLIYSIQDGLLKNLRISVSGNA